MDRLTDEDFAYMIEQIQSEDSFHRGLAIDSLWRHNTGDGRMMPYFESCLTDTALCWFGGAPFRYTEVRFVAAHALMTLRKNLGSREPVSLEDVVAPIGRGGIMSIARSENIPMNISSSDNRETELKRIFALLQDKHKLPVIDLDLKYDAKYDGAHPYGRYYLPSGIALGDDWFDGSS